MSFCIHFYKLTNDFRKATHYIYDTYVERNKDFPKLKKRPETESFEEQIQKFSTNSRFAPFIFFQISLQTQKKIVTPAF